MNVAIIGTGYIAARHATALQTLPDIAIAGHVDVVPEGAQKAAAQFGGRGYASAQELLDNETVDAVWLCVPPFAHGELEELFLEKGVPMYIEKPVGVDVDGPAAIAQKIAAKNAIVNVGYYWRCMEIMPKLRQMLAETPPRLVRAAYHGPTAPAAWWRVQAKSGGQIVEQATHLVDIARHLLGEATVVSAVAAHQPREAYPDMDIATASAAILQFDSGVFGTLTATCVLDSFIDTGIEFMCEGRKISLSLRELAVETAEGRTVESTGTDPLVIADQAFIEAVRTKDASKLPCPYDEALRTQQLGYSIYQAAKEGDK